LASPEIVKFQVFVQDDLLFLQYFWVSQKASNKLKYLEENDDESVMRRASFFILFIFNFSLLAYEINLSSERTLKNCKSSSSEKAFYCKNDDGDEYFIKESGWEYIAFKRTASGKYEEKDVFEIYDSGGMDVFIKPLSRGDMFTPKSDNFYRGDMASFSSGLAAVNSRFFAFEEDHEKIEEHDEEIYKFVESVKKNYEEQRKHYDSLMNSSTLHAELEDGQSMKCRRAPGNPNCNLLDCGTDKKGNKVLLLKDRYGEGAYFESFSYKNGNISKTGSRVKGIYGSNGQTLLEIKDGPKNEKFSSNMLVPGDYHKNPDLFESLTTYSAVGMLLDDFNTCSPKMGKLLQRTVEKAVSDLENAQMVQLIEFTNGAIESNFVNLETLPDYACVHKGVYYSPESYQRAKDIKRSSKKTISLEKAQELHDKAKARDDIAWDYTFDGCYARAHLMARMFEEQGVHVDKAWLRGSLQVPGEADTMKWGYHVAPLVYVEEPNGSIKEMIIDPSISDKPLSPEKWSALMEVEFDKTKRVAYPTPTNTARFRKTSYAVTNSEPYWPDLDTNLTEEMKIRMAKDTMDQYRSGVDPWGEEWQQW